MHSLDRKSSNEGSKLGPRGSIPSLQALAIVPTQCPATPVAAGDRAGWPPPSNEAALQRAMQRQRLLRNEIIRRRRRLSRTTGKTAQIDPSAVAYKEDDEGCGRVGGQRGWWLYIKEVEAQCLLVPRKAHSDEYLAAGLDPNSTIVWDEARSRYCLVPWQSLEPDEFIRVAEAFCHTVDIWMSLIHRAAPEAWLAPETWALAGNPQERRLTLARHRGAVEYYSQRLSEYLNQALDEHPEYVTRMPCPLNNPEVGELVQMNQREVREAAAVARIPDASDDL